MIAFLNDAQLEAEILRMYRSTWVMCGCAMVAGIVIAWYVQEPLITFWCGGLVGASLMAILIGKRMFAMHLQMQALFKRVREGDAQ
jgi:hypothetical protein